MQVLSCRYPGTLSCAFALYLPRQGGDDFLSHNRDGSLVLLLLAASRWCGVSEILLFAFVLLVVVFWVIFCLFAWILRYLKSVHESHTQNLSMFTLE